MKRRPHDLVRPPKIEPALRLYCGKLNRSLGTAPALRSSSSQMLAIVPLYNDDGVPGKGCGSDSNAMTAVGHAGLAPGGRTHVVGSLLNAPRSNQIADPSA